MKKIIGFNALFDPFIVWLDNDQVWRGTVGRKFLVQAPFRVGKHLLAARQLPASEYLLARETCNCSKLEVSANLCSSTLLTEEVQCDEWKFSLEKWIRNVYLVLLRNFNLFFMPFNAHIRKIFVYWEYY